ncbi:MAG: hypothetical protein KJ000_35700 [Pirellulaceae bacterium]|nr:hypothetical protein [Pirellulaceae bacterium]
MTATLNIWLTLVLSVASMLLSLVCLRSDIRLRRVTMFYWASTIIFLKLPLLLDSTLLISGAYDAYVALVLESKPTHWFTDDPNVLLHAASYALLFDVTFLVAITLLRIIFGSHPPLYEPFSPKDISPLPASTEFILVAVAWLPCILLVYYGADFIQREEIGGSLPRWVHYSSLLLPLGAARSYEAIVRQRYALAAVYSAPIATIFFLTGSRAGVTAVFTALLLGKLRTKLPTVRPIVGRAVHPLRDYLAFGIAGLTILAALYSVREAQWFGNASPLANALALTRDLSTGEYYYCLGEIADHERTNGRATQALVLSSVLPRFLARETFSDENDVVFALWRARHGFDKSYASSHPTIYGWAYFDLGLFGFVVAIFIAVISEVGERVLSTRIEHRGTSAALFGSFFLVSARGSLMFSYVHLLYSGIILFLLIEVCRLGLSRRFK